MGSAQSPTAPARGLAMVAVLGALSVLLALLLPFLLSVGQGEATARLAVDERRADWASASVRDLLLQEAGYGAFDRDPDPLTDGREEFPESLELPEGFQGLSENGRTLLAGEVWDLQSRLAADSLSPLVLGNLLGLATRMRGQFGESDGTLEVDDASGFPDSGMLLLGDEVIRYAERDDRSFFGLERAVLADLGFRRQPLEAAPSLSLVLDLRCAFATALPFLGRGNPSLYEPFQSVRDLAALDLLGLEPFDRDQIDRLEKHCALGVLREHATRYGKPERVFAVLEDEWQHERILVVRSALGIAAGSMLRIRREDGSATEYALVLRVERQGPGTGDVTLPSARFLHLLTPLSQRFAGLETVVEPMVPQPVNVNTASVEVLTALFAHLRRWVRDNPGVPELGPDEARRLAERIVELREVENADGTAASPFDGWEDFYERLFQPLLVESNNVERTRMLQAVWENLLLGRSDAVEMGTAPIAFHSGPAVAYRAAALLTNLGGRELARHERRGIGFAAPEGPAFWGATTQEVAEEYLRLDRHSAFYQSYPTNTSAVVPGAGGQVPPARTQAHTLADAFPDMGFGNPRFPEREADSSSALGPQPSSTPVRALDGGVRSHDSFSFAQHPDGRDLRGEGAYQIANSVDPQGGALPSDNDHSRIRFPLTEGGGLVGRHAISFWFRLEDISPQGLYDLVPEAENQPERNRIVLQIRDQSLWFEVFDEAGLDPNPNVTLDAPQRSVGTWELPLADVDLRADTWYHVSLSAQGNQPGQLTLLVDGVPRGQPRYRTFLTAPIDAYQEPPFGTVRTVADDQARYLPLRVEDTTDFPERGVLRIGYELFEYTSKDASTFYCVFDDSRGGRAARMRLRELGIPLPLTLDEDRNGELQAMLDPSARSALETAPDHPQGAAVELYGYSIPVFPQRTLWPGAMQLADAIGSFAVARVGNQQGLDPFGRIYQSTTGGSSVEVDFGSGFDATTTPAELYLSNPQQEQYPPDPADQRILDAFPAGGGFALLVQSLERWRAPLGFIGEDFDFGGVEVIRYQSREGNLLKGITRNAQLTGFNFAPDGEGFFTNEARTFLMEIRMGTGAQEQYEDLPLFYPYVVPISLPVTGAVPGADPLVRWAQIYGGGTAENDLEWVRYNLVEEGRHLVRAEQAAYDLLRSQVTGQFERNTQDVFFDESFSPSVAPRADRIAAQPWPVPDRDDTPRVGRREEVEYDFPVVASARVGLRFRGDHGTSPHPHPQGRSVLPVHRFGFDRWHARSTIGRSGRGDRVALVQGSQRQNGQPANVEWHTVTWTHREYRSDPVSLPGTASQPNGVGGRESLGQWPFQLVGFREGVRDVYLGEAGPTYEELQDVRLMDRLVKFPSGELPAGWVQDASIGESPLADLIASQGIVDELTAIARSVTPRWLDQQLRPGAASFFVRPDVLITPAGALVDAAPDQRVPSGPEVFPEDGGLLWIDGEVLAYRNYDPASGEMEVAADGRGLLGTEERGHDEGALVYFLEQVPAAILRSGISAESATLPVESLGQLPIGSGTVLSGRELIHYTWTRGNSLEMPGWRDPDDRSGRRSGLFRGRYGTNPAGAASGAPLIWFPTRFWDRYRERSDDPEQSYLQLTLEQGPSFFRSFGWRELAPDPLVDLHCLVRIDGYGRWDDDPEEGVLRRLTSGQAGGGGALHRLDLLGSRLEARFVQIYRPGSFDPETFRAQSWKRGPRLGAFALEYEGERRILREEVLDR